MGHTEMAPKSTIRAPSPVPRGWERSPHAGTNSQVCGHLLLCSNART